MKKSESLFSEQNHNTKSPTVKKINPIGKTSLILSKTMNITSKKRANTQTTNEPKSIKKSTLIGKTNEKQNEPDIKVILT